MKVVIDTNVLISGIFWTGTPYEVLRYWRNSKIEVLTSTEIIEEYTEIIKRISKDQDLILYWTSFIATNSTIVEPVERGKFSRDPKDDKFIDCAIYGKANFLITGDKDLLEIEEAPVSIVTPREIYDIVKKRIR